MDCRLAASARTMTIVQTSELLPSEASHGTKTALSSEPTGSRYADLSGSRHTGKPNFSQRDDADEQPDPLNGFLENFVWTLSPADFLSLWIHHVEGASAADLARQLDKHRGTVGRRLDRLAEEAKAGALAALAALMIGKGADRFLLCPRSGKRLASLDQE